jgi:hypothetical protein
MTSYQHTIEAALYKSPIKDDPNELYARVKSNRFLTIADVCRSAEERNKNAIVSASVMESVVKVFLDEMIYRLCDGFSIHTGAFSAAPKIRGVFHSPDEPFDPSRHRFLFEMHQGSDLRREIESVAVHIQGMAPGKAHVAQVVDAASQTTNDRLTPGNNLTVSGRNLKLVGPDEAVGVYFVCRNAAGDGTRVKVDAAALVINHPSKLIFIVPPLEEGVYHLEVVTQYGGNSKTVLKHPNTLLLDRLLTVTTTLPYERYQA